MEVLVCSCGKEAKSLVVVTAVPGEFRFWGEPFRDKKSLNESDSPGVRRETGG